MDDWGGPISAAIEFFGNERTNKQNKALAREHRAWQERMSNTAHQRQVDDLRAAGLNPILSAKYGGASTPSGGFATMTNSAKGLGELGRKLSRQKTELNQIKAQTKVANTQAGKNEADTDKARQDKRTGESIERVNNAQLGVMAEQIVTNRALQDQYRASARASDANAASEEAALQFLEDNRIYRHLDKIGNIVAPITGAAAGVIGGRFLSRGNSAKNLPPVPPGGIKGPIQVGPKKRKEAGPGNKWKSHTERVQNPKIYYDRNGRPQPNRRKKKR